MIIDRRAWGRTEADVIIIGAGLGETLVGAVKVDSGRLIFAGEHLTRGASGIEGALESGERAAKTIIAGV